MYEIPLNSVEQQGNYHHGVYQLGKKLSILSSWENLKEKAGISLIIRKNQIFFLD